jgi:uncharacterized protein (TIGR03435 family)
MVVPVLEERFKPVVHRQTKELPVYALVVEKSGPKFKEGDSGEGNVRPDGTGAFVYKNYGMQEPADALSGILERATLNRTGLEGSLRLSSQFAEHRGGIERRRPEGAALENQGDSPVSLTYKNNWG